MICGQFHHEYEHVREIISYMLMLTPMWFTVSDPACSDYKKAHFSQTRRTRMRTRMPHCLDMDRHDPSIGSKAKAKAKAAAVCSRLGQTRLEMHTEVLGLGSQGLIPGSQGQRKIPLRSF